MKYGNNGHRVFHESSLLKQATVKCIYKFQDMAVQDMAVCVLQCQYCIHTPHYILLFTKKSVKFCTRAG